MKNWWRGAVTYQIYPRSFQDSNGDGIGDLPGITSRLQYAADLGVDAIWLSPIFTSPMADMGYDVSDYKGIDPLFGTLEDFDKLVARAHELGLKVIVDQVISHTSDKHPWFLESRSSKDNAKADWYVWAETKRDGTPPTNWLSTFGGPAWEWDTTRRQYYLHNFLASQPDLNFHNFAVQDALIDTMRFWLERGVDGFRMDTVNYYFHDKMLRDNPAHERNDPRPEVNPIEMQYHMFSKNRPENLAFLERFRALLDEFPERTSVGELGDSQRATELMAQYTAGGNRLHSAYSFDMLSPNFSAGFFRSRIEGFFKAAPDAWPGWSFSNHDVQRHVTRWKGYSDDQAALAKLAAAMLLSFEGSIYLYQGEELGLAETDIEYHELTDPPGFKFWPEYKGRDGCRTPMVWTGGNDYAGFSTVKPWLPVKAPQAFLNVAGQAGKAGSVLEFYKAMLAFRKSRVAMVEGRSRFFDTREPVFAFQRGTGKGAVLAVFNLSKDALNVGVSGASMGKGPSQNAVLAGGKLDLGPNGFAVMDCSGEVSVGY